MRIIMKRRNRKKSKTRSLYKSSRIPHKDALHYAHRIKGEDRRLYLQKSDTECSEVSTYIPNENGDLTLLIKPIDLEQGSANED